MYFITTSGALEQNKHTNYEYFCFPSKYFRIFFPKYVKELRASVDTNIFSLLNTTLSSGKKNMKN